MSQQILVPSQTLQVRSETSPVSTHSTAPARLSAPPAALVENSPVYRRLSRVRWSCRIWALRIGPLGRLGLGFAVLGAVLYLAAVLPSRSDIAHGQEEISSLQGKIRREIERSAPMTSGPADELNRFYQFMPPDSEVSNALRKVYRISAEQGLRLEQAEYRVATEGHGRLFRYEMTFPVLGAYPQIRMFLRRVSAEIPSAVPDKVSFEYQNEKTGQVRARISLMLYSRTSS